MLRALRASGTKPTPDVAQRMGKSTLGDVGGKSSKGGNEEVYWRSDGFEKQD